MKKFTLIIFTIFLLNSCSSKINNNLIGVHFDFKKSPFLYQNLKNELNKIAFYNNLTIFYNDEGEINLEKFLKLKPRLVFIEENNLKNLKKIYKKFKSHNIEVSLISETIDDTKYCDNLFTFDFESLGKEFGDAICTSTKKERSIFVILLNKNNKINPKFIEGMSKSFINYNTILVTNFYDNQIDEDYINTLILKYSENLRAFIIDNSTYGALVAKYIRKIGQDRNIKVASYGTSIEGLCSLLRFETIFIADTDIFNLYVNALNLVINKLKTNSRANIIYYYPGLIYSQINIMEKIALTKKFDIQELLLNCKKKD